jgi:hypothetical protein
LSPSFQIHTETLAHILHKYRKSFRQCTHEGGKGRWKNYEIKLKSSKQTEQLKRGQIQINYIKVSDTSFENVAKLKYLRIRVKFKIVFKRKSKVE